MREALSKEAKIHGDDAFALLGGEARLISTVQHLIVPDMLQRVKA